jgi:hypothetical protein
LEYRTISCRDYLNFRFGDLQQLSCHIAKGIISNIPTTKKCLLKLLLIESDICENGFYKNGKLNLAIINKSRAFNLTLKEIKK